jgi:hypothetical protein
VYGAPPPAGVTLNVRFVPAHTALDGRTEFVLVKAAPAVSVTLAVDVQPPFDAVTVYVVVVVTAVATGFGRVSCPVINVEGVQTNELIDAGAYTYILPLAGAVEFPSSAVAVLEVFEEYVKLWNDVAVAVRPPEIDPDEGVPIVP